jgi:hypothetical protein
LRYKGFQRHATKKAARFVVTEVSYIAGMDDELA